jgi:hypothetical protein
MKRLKPQTQGNVRIVAWFVCAIGLLGGLLLYRLGSLTHGLSQGELQVANAAVGWHGIYHAPLDLPLKAIRSVAFYVSPTHGQTLTRLPNAILGALAIISFTWLSWLWHGRRTALLVSALFATSAWVLHVSRYASFDVLYLWGITTLLLTHALLHRYQKPWYIWYGVLAFWGILLTIPGMIWFLLPELYIQRALVRKGFRTFGKWWQRGLSIIVAFLWVPLLTVDFTRHGQVLTWLGAPAHFAKPATLLKQLVGVPVHLFIRGPEYPALWLGRAPLLDAFTLAMCALGIYFYGSHWRSTRGSLLEIMFIVAIILVALGGPVSFTALVPLMYAAAAMGIAYLLHEWLQVFPRNPLARSLGIGLVTLAVAISCLYNVRAYFVAWVHTPATQAIFRYRR